MKRLDIYQKKLRIICEAFFLAKFWSSLAIAKLGGGLLSQRLGWFAIGNKKP